MQLKKLQEQRAELLAKIELENKSETRSVEAIDELLNDVEKINEEIKREERLLDMTNFTTEVKQVEKRDYNAEIRSAIQMERELDMTKFEIEERGIGYGEAGGNAQMEKSVGNIAKKTFANEIIKKATETSDLYQYVRKENVGSGSHQIPVQKDKIGEFASVTELNDYAKARMDFEPVLLGAHKFGNYSIISEEALADTGYDLMAELMEQYGEAAGLTLDKLMVQGSGANIQGLNSFNNAGVAQSNAILVDVDTADLVADNIMIPMFGMYNKLPHKYRKNATWVIGTDLAAVLSMATDGVGRPLLTTDFSQVPFGGKEVPMLLGRPVVISDYVTNFVGAGAANDSLAFFGDLSKALVLGLRQNFTIKSSTELAWLKDGVAVKGTMRLDVKRALGESIVVLKRTNG